MRVKARCSIDVASIIVPVNFYTQNAHLECAGSHETGCHTVASGIYLVNFHTNGSCEMSMCMSTAQASKTWMSGIFPPKFHTKCFL